MKNNIFKSIVLPLVLALFVLGGVYMYSQSRNTVVLTEQGFFPRELSIKLGDTVTFVNKRNKYFWVASDFHPTHSVYPEFDTMQALPPGSSWSFTFDRDGLFKYHDHLAPFFFGVIRVSNADGIFSDSCEQRGGNLSCWQDQIFLALAEKGIQGAYDTVAALYKSDQEFAQSCHFIAHNIGLASYGFYRENPKLIISPNASVCASGFYHGFMEAFLGATGDVKSASATCEYIGEALKNDAPDARLQCYHGIGHGITEYIISSAGNFNTLNEMVREATSQCEEASEGEEERFRCMSGLFNGVANFYINGEYGLTVEKENPLSLCEHQPDNYQEACYGNMNSVVFLVAKNNFLEAAQSILLDKNNKHQEKALQYLSGLYAYYKLPSYNAQEIVDECHSLNIHALTCVRGFAHGLLEHGTPQEEYKDALLFCRTSTLAVDERDVCYKETLSELNGWYSIEKSNEICNSISEELQKYCKK